MKERNIKVSQKFLIEMAKTRNLEELIEDKAKAFEYKGEKYVSVSAIGDGKGIGYRLAVAFKAILLKNYTGSVTPMYYVEHTHAVLEGIRERGYEGRIVNISDVPHVLTEQTCFIDENN